MSELEYTGPAGSGPGEPPAGGTWTPPDVLVSPPLEATRSERRAVRIMQLGAVLVVLVAATYRQYELDRFFVPKELVLHVTAAFAALLLARSLHRVRLTGVDLLLALFLLLSLVSAGFATNPWLAARAVAVTASGLALFWGARAARDAGYERALLGAVAVAVVLGVATSLAQAYGVRTDFFSLNRAPGGTLGNRNFVAHLGAFGLPVVLLMALRARHFLGYLLGAVASGVVIASLVLTRSRAAWLALAAVLVVLAAAMIAAPSLRRHGRTWFRLLLLVVLTGAAVGAAVVLPNSLRWRSDNPYLESMRGVVNYSEGSGAGRLVQYRQSLRMAVAHPLLGVGPGNWAVEYPDFAARNDPSLDRGEPGTTSNPWPSSDWVALVSERGFAAALLLGVTFLAFFLAGARQLFRAHDPDQALAATALLGTLLAASVAGLFDAVLLLALPTLLVWIALGALWTPPPRPGRHFPAAALVLVGLLSLAGAARSAAQLVSIGIASSTDRTGWLSLGARIDPGNYRLRLRLARAANGREARCTHARAAYAQFPHAGAARSAHNRCD